MKIVIATGIYPPEIGGPALYAQGVSESLQKSGHTVALAVFTPYKKYPSGIRHLLYMFDLARCAWRADVIVAFDTASVGVPSACVGMLLRMPVVVRVGGDFLWEQYVERTHQLIPLPHLYTAVRTFSFKENIIRASTKFLARHTQLAFNTQWLADIWQAPYALESSRVHIIENIIGERVQTETPTQKNILLYGRPIVIKNVPAFSRAFEVAHSDISDIVLETGSVPHSELMSRIAHGYAVALPSISEVAPNMVIDSICRGKPFLLTKHSGYAERFKDYGIIVDPLDEASMAQGIRSLADRQIYEQLRARIRAYTEVRTYDDVAREMLSIVHPQNI